MGCLVKLFSRLFIPVLTVCSIVLGTSLIWRHFATVLLMMAVCLQKCHLSCWMWAGSEEYYKSNKYWTGHCQSQLRCVCGGTGESLTVRFTTQLSTGHETGNIGETYTHNSSICDTIREIISDQWSWEIFNLLVTIECLQYWDLLSPRCEVGPAMQGRGRLRASSITAAAEQVTDQDVSRRRNIVLSVRESRGTVPCLLTSMDMFRTFFLTVFLHQVIVEDV